MLPTVLFPRRIPFVAWATVCINNDAVIVERVPHAPVASLAVAASIEKDIRARSAAGAFDALTSANAFTSALG
jgi:hypothetical protein